jgi:tetratricopeptide (TPR) repeat protein
MKEVKKMKKTLINSLFAASLLVAAPSWSADDKPVLDETQQATSDKAIARQEGKQNAMLQAINENVVAGFAKVQEAARLLTQEGREKEAIAALEAATAKFDIALVAKPDLSLVPIDTRVAIAELITTPEMIADATETAVDLLKDGKLQAARKLLLPLRDEMVTETVLLPMETYPDAIKLATAELIKGDKDKALAILDEAFSTFVVMRSVLPLSLLRAEAFIIDAAALDKEKDREKALKLVKAAEMQLEVAVLLGYADKKSAAYEDLQDLVKDLKKEIEGGNVVEKLYYKLKQGLRKLIGEESRQQSVESGSEG